MIDVGVLDHRGERVISASGLEFMPDVFSQSCANVSCEGVIATRADCSLIACVSVTGARPRRATYSA
jgi:hypothetical protein